MPPAKMEWWQLKVPSSTEQRIALLDACQRQFETVSALGPVSGALRRPTELADEYKVVFAGTFTALDDNPHDVIEIKFKIAAPRLDFI